MKILYIIKRTPDASTKKIMDVQSAGNEITSVDLAKGGVNYDKLVADVFGHDRVICW